MTTAVQRRQQTLQKAALYKLAQRPGEDWAAFEKRVRAAGKKGRKR